MLRNTLKDRLEMSESVQWIEWMNVGEEKKKLVRVGQHGTIRELFENLVAASQKFARHLHTAAWQHKQYLQKVKADYTKRN